MGPTPLHEITTEELRHYMNINFETNFCEYAVTYHKAKHRLMNMSSCIQSFRPILA